jgi:ankyrin repeat protein
VDANRKDKGGKTVLHKAIYWNKNESLILLLLEAGADVNLPDSDGYTPFALACRARVPFRSIVTGMIAFYGAQMEAEDKYGRTVLGNAAKHSLKFTKFLIEIGKPSLKAKGALLLQPYLLPAVARYLLGTFNGLSLLEQDKNGNTAVHMAAKPSRLEMLHVLLQYEGPHVESLDSEGRTPLALACTRGYLEMADALLGAVANVDLAGDRGWSPLMLAIIYRQESLARFLIETHGARVDVLDSLSRSALHHAAKKILRGHD